MSKDSCAKTLSKEQRKTAKIRLVKSIKTYPFLILSENPF